MVAKLQLRNPNITHFIPAAPDWRIALCMQDGDSVQETPIIGWVVCSGQPLIQPVFHHCGAAIIVSALDPGDAYEILSPGQSLTKEIRQDLREEAGESANRAGCQKGGSNASL